MIALLFPALQWLYLIRAIANLLWQYMYKSLWYVYGSRSSGNYRIGIRTVCTATDDFLQQHHLASIFPASVGPVFLVDILCCEENQENYYPYLQAVRPMNRTLTFLSHKIPGIQVPLKLYQAIIAMDNCSNPNQNSKLPLWGEHYNCQDPNTLSLSYGHLLSTFAEKVHCRAPFKDIDPKFSG